MDKVSTLLIAWRWQWITALFFTGAALRVFWGLELNLLLPILLSAATAGFILATFIGMAVSIND